MKFSLTSKQRHALKVAMAVANELEVNIQKGLPLGGAYVSKEVRQATLLSIQNETFRFEGGTVIKVTLVNLPELIGDMRLTEWWVKSVTVSYYPATSREAKVSEVWEYDKLLALVRARPWGADPSPASPGLIEECEKEEKDWWLARSEDGTFWE